MAGACERALTHLENVIALEGLLSDAEAANGLAILDEVLSLADDQAAS